MAVTRRWVKTCPRLPPLTIFCNDDLEATEGWLAERSRRPAPPWTGSATSPEPVKPDGSRNPRQMSLYGRSGWSVRSRTSRRACSASSTRCGAEASRIGPVRGPVARQQRRNGHDRRLPVRLLHGHHPGLPGGLGAPTPTGTAPTCSMRPTTPSPGTRTTTCACARLGWLPGGHRHQDLRWPSATSPDSAFPRHAARHEEPPVLLPEVGALGPGAQGWLIRALRVKIRVPTTCACSSPLQRLGSWWTGWPSCSRTTPARLTRGGPGTESKTGWIPDHVWNLLGA